VADEAPESALPPLFDIDKGLREMARHRGRRDTLTRSQAQLGDSMAEYLSRHFSAEEIETAGRALLVAASCAGHLVAEGVNRPEVIINIIAMAAARMVTDGRAWTEAGNGETDGR
jgi:hypothetical protein